MTARVLRPRDPLHPRWRGPADNGVAPKGNPPVRWSPTENVRWKAAIPGRGTWKRVVREAMPHQGCHRKASFAATSPITDGKHLYCFSSSKE